VSFYVYGIKSSRTGRVYVGQGKDDRQRLRQHNAGHVSSTRTDRPWTLVAEQTVETRAQARWIEYQLKKRGANGNGGFAVTQSQLRQREGATRRRAEGFERLHVPEKLQFYNVARGSTAEVRSLLYVIEDNFPQRASQSIVLRDEIVGVGKLVSGLIRSTEGRKTAGHI
jgi:four helix bundle protein